MFTVATLSPVAPDVAPETHQLAQREDAIDLAWRLAHGCCARPLWNAGWVWAGCKAEGVDGVPIGGFHISNIPEPAGAGVVVFSDDPADVAQHEFDSNIPAMTRAS